MITVQRTTDGKFAILDDSLLFDEFDTLEDAAECFEKACHESCEQIANLRVRIGAIESQIEMEKDCLAEWRSGYRRFMAEHYDAEEV